MQRADEYRVYLNTVTKDLLNEKEDVLPENVIADPTLPRARARCRNCESTEAVWFQSNEVCCCVLVGFGLVIDCVFAFFAQTEAEKMILTFICLNCHAHWTG